MWRESTGVPRLRAIVGRCAAEAQLYSHRLNEATRLLNAINNGEAWAAEELLPLVYQELRRLGAQRLAQEAPGQTLDATALVHEAYLRLVGSDQPQPRWDGRGHFFAAAAEAMRRVLIESARKKNAQ